MNAPSSALALLEQLTAELRRATEAPVVAPTPRFLTVKGYAAHAAVSTWQVRAWIKLGLPVTKAPGRTVVIVEQADQWIINGGAPSAARAAGEASARAVATVHPLRKEAG